MFRSQFLGYQNVLSVKGLPNKLKTPLPLKDFPPFEFGRIHIPPILGEN